MKRLNDNGLEEIVSQTKFGNPDQDRPFPITAISWEADPPYRIVGTFTLASGTSYNYFYDWENDLGAAIDAVETLQRSPPAGYKGLTGGRFFNRSVRPRLAGKLAA